MALIAEAPRPRRFTDEEIADWHLRNGMVPAFFWAHVAWGALASQALWGEPNAVVLNG